MEEEELKLFLDTISPVSVESNKKVLIVCAPGSGIGRAVHMHIAAHREAVIVTAEQCQELFDSSPSTNLIIDDMQTHIETRLELESLSLHNLPADKPNNRAGRRGRKFDPLKSTSKFF